MSKRLLGDESARRAADQTFEQNQARNWAELEVAGRMEDSPAKDRHKFWVACREGARKAMDERQQEKVA